MRIDIYPSAAGFTAMALDDRGEFIDEASGSDQDQAYDRLVAILLNGLTATTCCDCGTSLAVRHPVAQSICIDCANKRRQRAIVARKPRVTKFTRTVATDA